MKNDFRKQEIAETDIAIIGMSCRFPGAKNVNEFWNNLKNGKESITFFTEEELENENKDEKLIKAPYFVKAGSVLDDIKLFDAEFFGFSEQEAKIIDPQHRKFLECSWEALEDGGYNPDMFDGSIGVFAGAGVGTYFLNNIYPSIEYSFKQTFLESMEGLQLLMANDRDYLPTRVSYKLNLRGPSINVQAACSTSLVAVHLACQSIINGECDMALAGAVTILCPQKVGYLYQEDMILSPDGHCRPFDAKARGTVFGSGIGVVLLKKFSDAIRDGDAIHAVIKGTAVNNDGSIKAGYSAPSVDGQAAVIAEAMAFAGVKPEDVTFIEAHGTATQLGDLIEVTALKQVFQTNKKHFCALGSVKSNIGHLGWAAGMAGLIKAILSLKHRQIPPTLHFEKPNPQINFKNLPFFVNTKTIPWKSKGLRIAGVNAFGFGGTNAHVVICEAQEQKRNSSISSVDENFIFTLSAPNDNSLKTLAKKYLCFFSKATNESLINICYTSNIGRKSFNKRIGFIASSLEELQSQLKDFINFDSPQEYIECKMKYYNDKSRKKFRDRRFQMLKKIVKLYESGKKINWELIYKGYEKRRIHLPIYPFQYKEYWLEAVKNSMQTSGTVEDGNWTNNFYGIQYKEQPQYGSAARYLIRPQQLKNKLSKRFKNIAQLSELGRYGQFFRSMEKLSYRFIVNAFYHIGYNFDLKKITTDEFIYRFSVLPKYKKLINRFFEILEEEGNVTRDKDGWRVHKIPKISNILPINKNNDFPELELLYRCGSRLAEVLQGNEDPLNLLFPNSDINFLKKLYTESPTLKMMNMVIAEAVTLLGKNIPKITGLRILEIGGGTGSTTAYIIKKFSSDKIIYTFTDISRRFISEARDCFSDYPYISYAQLDIEQSPNKQGFGEEKYDVIIATNVLHATQDLRQAIKNTNKLLAPGGILILLEGVAPVRWVDVTFGLTDGWWRFTDYDLRPNYPLLSPVKWQRELENFGFSEVVNISSDEIGSSINFDGGLPQTVIFAKKNNNITKKSPRNFLIFADNSGLGDKLEKKLTEQGGSCILVRQGEEFGVLTPGLEYKLNLYKLEDFNLFFSYIHQSIQKVIYLWPLNKTIGQRANEEEIEKQYLQCCGGLLNIVKSLVNNLSVSPSLFVVTHGSQFISKLTDLNTLIQSSVWGMSRVIAVEHPEFNCKIIDIESINQVNNLIDELDADNKEDQVILRSEARYVPRLIHKNINIQYGLTSKSFFKDNAIYLITGGLGGLGLKAAEWMIDNGARHIILVGRRPPSTIAQRKINLLNSRGAKIHIAQCDVSSYNEVQKLFSGLKKIGLVRGIIHAAGVIDDGVLLQQNFDRFLKPARAKVIGSWNLHKASLQEGFDLDFFILFSSVVSIIGNIGQSNHASANRFMNSLALYRRFHNLPATVIQWGAWADIGTLAKYPEVAKKLNSIGIDLINQDEGIKALNLVFLRGVTNIIYAPVDWKVFLESNKVKHLAFFSELLYTQQEQQNIKQKKDNIFTQILSLPISERFAAIKRRVAEHVNRLLGFEESDAFSNEDKNFFDYGMDSLISIQLRNSLQLDFKCSLHPTIAYQYPTIKKLSEYLTKNIQFNDRNSFTEGGHGKDIIISSKKRELSIQQKRWLQLTKKNYGRLLIPILFHDKLNKKAFRFALKQVVNRHEVLRYKFSDTTAFIVDTKEFLPNDHELFTDISDLSKIKQRNIITQLANQLRLSPPDPKNKPTWEIKCIKLTSKKFLILLHIQHLEFDGASVSIFVDDFRRFYSNYINGVDNSYLPAVQYNDYVKWQKRYMSTNISSDRDFFKNLFADVVSVTFLPNYSNHKITRSYPSACYTPPQIDGLGEQLQLIGKNLKVSPFAIVCGMYAQLIGEIVKNNQVIIGTIVSSRPSAEFEKTIGPFVQPFPMKISLAGSIKDIILQVYELITEINDRSRYPVTDMINHIPVFSDMEIDTYFTDPFIMFNNYPREANIKPKVKVLESLGPIIEEGLPNLTSETLNEIAGLFLIIDYFKKEMRFNFWYHLHRFPKEQVQDWAQRYLDILKENIRKLLL